MRVFLSIASIFLLSLGGASPIWGGVVACDDDGDTVPCEVDNCLNVPNGRPNEPVGALVGQCDTDRDGYGNACDCDIDNDGVCGGPDFGPVTANFGATGHPVDPADLNCDGVVGGPDYGPITANFGTPPGPSGLPCAGTIPCP